MKNSTKYYEIENPDKIVTPSLLFYPNIIEENIIQALQYVHNNPLRLRPHIKTFKNKNILQLLQKYKINQVKTATITETKLAAAVGIKDILFAQQPTIAKLNLIIDLIKTFPEIHFSILIDNENTLKQINHFAQLHNITIHFYLDINTGMNRTGHLINEQLQQFLQNLIIYKNLSCKGFHLYDGHYKNIDWKLRTHECLNIMDTLNHFLIDSNIKNGELIYGGSATFYFYSQFSNVVCSPGTFVLWDKNYSTNLPELNFKYAAVLLSTVISKPNKDYICIDLGHKSVASENPINQRVHILNIDGLEPISQSEEHFVFKNTLNLDIPIGTVLYIVPFHICPTVNLYNQALIIKENKIINYWEIMNKNQIQFANKIL